MRNYIVASWNDADQYDYSGEQIGNRLSKSQRVHFNPDGSACVASYADPEPAKRTTSIPIRDRILPQAKRVNTLTNQLIELEAEYKADQMSIDEYTTLRAVLIAKRDRAQVLYKKAISVLVKNDSEEDLYNSNETAYSCGQTHGKNDDRVQDMPVWLLELSEDNMFKPVGIKILKVLIIISKIKLYIRAL